MLRHQKVEMVEFIKTHYPELYLDIRSTMLHEQRGYQALEVGQICVALTAGFGGMAGESIIYDGCAHEGDIDSTWVHPWTGDTVVSTYGEDYLRFHRGDQRFGVRPSEFVQRVRVVDWYNEIKKEIATNG